MFLNQIFDNKERPISDGSKKLYTANLTKLNDGEDIGIRSATQNNSTAMLLSAT